MALAQAVGAPRPWEIGMQPAFGPLKQQQIELHDLVLVIITLITLFVAGLLVWVMWRYNAKRNPVPTRTSHNTVLEIAWTVIPVLILVVMAIPSFRLVYYEDRTHDPDLTIKVTGHQWYWEYTYPDNNNLDFSSYIIPDDQLKPGQLRLLTVDNELVVPVGKNIRVLQTSADVIHSFFIPALGVQRYAIPGRTIETWFRVDQPGDLSTASATRSAAPTTAACRSWCARCRSRNSTPGWSQAKTKFSDAGAADPPARGGGGSALTRAVGA